MKGYREFSGSAPGRFHEYSGPLATDDPASLASEGGSWGFETTPTLLYACAYVYVRVQAYLYLYM